MTALRSVRARCSLLAVMTIGAPHALHAQTLAQRIRAVRDGTVELHYAGRPGLCGDGDRSFSVGGSMHVGGMTIRNGIAMRPPCVAGPVRVRLTLERGDVHDVRVAVGPPRARSTSEITDLGEVRAADAAAYLLELAAKGNTGGSTRSVTAAVLADSVSVWPRLVEIARDSSTRSRATRHEATFWLGLLAASKLEGRADRLDAPDEGDDGDDREDPRSSAVFALSQLRSHEGIAPLIQVARTNRDAHIRRKALFWLGESGDTRAVALFGEILSR